MKTAVDKIRELNRRAIGLDPAMLCRLQMIAEPQSSNERSELELVDSNELFELERAKQNKDIKIPSNQISSDDKIVLGNEVDEPLPVSDQMFSTIDVSAGATTSSAVPENELADSDILPLVPANPLPQREPVPQAEPVPAKPTPGPIGLHELQATLERSRQVDSASTVEANPVESEKIRVDAAHEVQRPFHQTKGGAVSNKEIRKLTDQLVDRYPMTQPTVMVLISDPNDNGEQQSVAYRLATELTSRSQNELLVLDAVGQVNGSQNPGLAELINRNEPVAHCLQQTDCDNMYIMDVGQGELTERKTRPDTIANLIASLKDRFQYVCIAAPSFDTTLTQLLTRYADVTFLIVNLEISGQEETRQLVNSLQHNGVRVGGCIVQQPKYWATV